MPNKVLKVEEMNYKNPLDAARREALEAERMQALDSRTKQVEIQRAVESSWRQAAKDGVPLKIFEANLASEFYKRLMEWINKFDATLDNANEVGVRLVNFGETVKFHLRDMSYYNPSLIMFAGELEDGSQVELIQHVSQISILLMKLPRKNPEEPKQPMGFHAIREDNQNVASEE